ncbi:MAG: Zn-ribbon domain-containing OB-fold protein [Conexivisphaerales archaeon]
MKTTEQKSASISSSVLAKKLAEDLGLSIDEKTGLPMFVSRRELIQKYIIPVSKISKFYEGLANGILFGTKCDKCKRLYFPPKADCDSCMESSMSFVKLSGKASLLAFTVISVKPTSFSKMEDYTVAIGRLDEGLNVLSWLSGAKLSDIRIGMKLKLKAGRRSEDNSLVYFFVPER